jgi:urocanate hydratase
LRNNVKNENSNMDILDVIMRDYIDKGGVTAPKESSSLHDGTNGIKKVQIYLFFIVLYCKNVIIKH